MNRARFALLAGAAGAASRISPLRAQTLTTIRFGTSPVESYALAYYAAERGFFRAAGLDVQITGLSGGGAIMSALAGGALDLACANVGAQANAHIRGLPIAMIAAGGLYSTNAPTTVLAVGKHSTAASGKDLNGKTVAVSTLRDLQQASVMKWVDANGGDSSSVRFLELPVPEMAPALVAARVDAATLLEPSLTYAASDVRVLGKCYDAIAKSLTITTHLGSADWLAQHPAPARAFIGALRKAAVWANADQRAAAGILAGVTKIPPETIEHMHRVTFGEALDAATIQPVIDATAQYHFLPRSFPVTEMFWTGRG